jgi:hypothetical protein
MSEPLSIPFQRKHSLSLIQIIRASFNAQDGAGALLLEANSAYDELKVNPTLRNIFMSLPSLADPPALMDSITSFYFSNESQELILQEESAQGTSTLKIRQRRKNSKDKIQGIVQKIFSNDAAMASYYQNSFPLCHQYKLFGMITFLTAILGDDFNDLGRTNLSMFTILYRLQKTETAMAGNTDISFQNGHQLGKLWRRFTDADRIPCLKRISSEFPSFLNLLAKDQYLDVILKIDVPGVVSPDNRSKPKGDSDPVTGVNLLSADKVLLGTVLVWDGFLSPEFKEGFTIREAVSKA